MAVEEGVVIAVIGVIVIEGIWLAALTYLMWRRAKRKRDASAEAEEPTTST